MKKKHRKRGKVTGASDKFKRKYFSVGRLVKIPVYLFTNKRPSDLIVIKFIRAGQAELRGSRLRPPYRERSCCSTWEEREIGARLPVPSLPSNCELFFLRPVYVTLVEVNVTMASQSQHARSAKYIHVLSLHAR